MMKKKYFSLISSRVMQSISRVHTRLIVKKLFSNSKNDQLLGFGNTSIKIQEEFLISRRKNTIKMIKLITIESITKKLKKFTCTNQESLIQT